MTLAEAEAHNVGALLESDGVVVLLLYLWLS